MIDLKVSKRLGEFSLSSELHDAGFLCLTGRNGAGKSTLLNIIAGLLAPDVGYVKINSHDVTNVPIEKRDVVLITPDSCIPHLEVSKHLEWGAKIRGLPVDPRFVQRVRDDLQIKFEGKVKKLSLGMRERVALATALISKPSAILIDEGFANIDDPDNFISAYRNLSSSTDVIFTSQRSEDKKFAEHHYVMVDGVARKEF